MAARNCINCILFGLAVTSTIICLSAAAGENFVKGTGPFSSVSSCNKYVDDLLRRFVQRYRSLDPYKMTNVRRELWDLSAGGAFITNNRLQGLSSMRRSADCALLFHRPGERSFEVRVPIKFSTLKMFSDVEANIRNDPYKMKLNGTFSDLKAMMKFTVTPRDNSQVFTGLGISGKMENAVVTGRNEKGSDEEISNYLASYVGLHWREAMAEVIQEKVAQLLRDFFVRNAL